MVMYKAYINMLPMNMQNLFVRSLETRHTRQESIFKRMYVRTETKSMSSSVYGVKFWNSLNNDLRSSGIYTFSKHVIRILVLLAIILINYDYFVVRT